MEQDIRKALEEPLKGAGAYWRHNGDAQAPHAVLTSGLHSDFFFNSEKVMERPTLLDEVACGLVSLFPLEHQRIDRVVGPALGAITLAHDVARNVELYSGHRCLRSYAEQKESRNNLSDEVTLRWMEFSRTEVLPGEDVLLVEDVISTGGSVERARTAVEAKGGRVLPYVLSIVNRSGLTKVGDLEIISIIAYTPSAWSAEECPLCKGGSAAIDKPKLNWAALIGA